MRGDLLSKNFGLQQKYSICEDYSVGEYSICEVLLSLSKSTIYPIHMAKLSMLYYWFFMASVAHGCGILDPHLFDQKIIMI